MSLAVTTVVQANCDVEKGAVVANKCVACHALDSTKSGVGPSLLGILGRPVASTENFRFSRAFRNLDLIWTAENLDQFLAAPQTFAKGNSMAFSGLKKQQDRADLICFLNRKTYEQRAEERSYDR